MATHQPTKKSKTRRRIKIWLIVLASLIAIRLALPYVVLYYANKTLANMDGYYGHIRDIDLAIYRGAYKINSIYINKVDSTTQKQIPFFDARMIDLSIEWRALFQGRIVGGLVFEEPTILFTLDKVEPGQVQEDTSDFRKLLKDFMPLKVNRFEVLQGRLRYNDPNSKPPVDIEMNRIYVLAKNLSNVDDSTVLLPSTVVANANVYDGTLDFNMRLNPLAETATFDMNAGMKNVDLVKLNDFFKAYGKFDVNKGTFGMYTELAARDKRFKGYVKPLITGLDVLGHEDRKDNFLQKLWESAVGAGGEVFSNQRKDQVATKVPMEGSFANPETDIWYTIVDLLRNAFIQAIQPSIDYEINIRSVNQVEDQKKGFFQRLFDKDEKEDDKKKPN